MKDSGFQSTGVMKSLPGSSHHNHGFFSVENGWVDLQDFFVSFAFFGQNFHHDYERKECDHHLEKAPFFC